MEAGLDLPIINPLDAELMGTIDAFHVLFYKDVDSQTYIKNQSKDKETKPAAAAATTNFTLKDVIIHGLKDEVEKVTKEELKDKEALTVINEVIIPALNIVGKDYETGKIFLPQLIQSAETTKKAFEVVKETFSANDGKEKGPIIIATVEGDIHDIGKNIVKVVLESYGYKIIDLGKDVKVEKVVEAYKKYKPKAIGLSALMREFSSRFLQIADPLAFLVNSPSKIFKPELFEAQTAHQAGCNVIKLRKTEIKDKF